MAPRPGDAIRLLTERLSRLLGTDEGTQILALLQRLGLLAAREGAEASRAPATESLRAGVWDPQLREDGAVEFLRSPQLAGEWRFWADVERIPPKRGPRAVLLGESVARGYLFDPALTAASVLEAMLATVPGLEDPEVVDLARSDLAATGLEPLFGIVPALEPDAIVLFAGNNWHNVVYEPDELQRLAEALRREGYAGCRRVVLEQILVARAEASMDALAEEAREFGFPVVVVVPEFNLVDWRSERPVLAPVLPEGRNVPWMAARERAEQALAAGRYAEAAGLAAEMAALDEGTSPVSQELLGRAALALGDAVGARARLEAARDAVCGLLIAHSPRCPAAVQDVLRRKSAEHGFELVDLPRVFERPGGGALPDRTLFLDYCHLTVEGLEAAMAAAAERLAPLLGAAGLPDPERAAIELDPADEAMGHFLAAIHNAHYGQSGDVLRHHCARALDLWPPISEQMLLFIDLQARAAEPWLCASFERLVASPAAGRYLVAHHPRAIERLADVALIEAIVDVLEAEGVEARRLLEDALVEEHAGPGPVDLLEPRYHASSFREREGSTLGPPRAFYRAFDLRSSFLLVQPEARPVRLRLTCRLPGANGLPAEVAVRVNGLPLERLAAGSAWETFELTVPPAKIRPGLNVLELEWPLLAPRWEEELERGARRLERSVYPDVLPAFGEIHAFAASAATG